MAFGAIQPGAADTNKCSTRAGVPSAARWRGRGLACVRASLWAGATSTLQRSPTRTLGRLMDGHMEKVIEDITKAYEKGGQSRPLTIRYKQIIKSVDGKSERKDIDDFVDNYFMARDSMAFREHIKSINPDINFDTKVTLADGTEQEVTVPMTVRFFWPNAEV